MSAGSRHIAPIRMPGARDLAINAMVTLSCVICGMAGLHFISFNSNVTMMGAPSGIALAAVLLCGPRLLPAAAIGAFAVNLWATHDPMTAAGVALANTLEASAGWWTLSRWARLDIKLRRIRDIVALIILGAAASPTIAATAGSLAMWLTGTVHAADFEMAWLAWWLGDALGILLFVPLILAWAQQPRLDLRRTEPWMALSLLAAQTITAMIVFQGWPGTPLGIERATYVLLPFAVLLAATCPVRHTAAANAILFAIAIWQTSLGNGPFAEGNPQINLLLLHVFLVIVSFTTLLVAGVNAERTKALRDTQDNLDRYQRLSELSAEWYWEQDENLRFQFVSGTNRDRAGLSSTQPIAKTRFELPNEFESGDAKRRHEEDLAAHRPFRGLILKRIGSDGRVRYASVSGQPIFDSDGAFKGYRGVGKDVTSQKLAAQLESKLRNYYAVLSEVNEVIVRTPHRDALFQQVCDIVARRGGVEFVRIAMLDEATRRLVTTNYSGNDHDLASRPYFSLDPDLEEGRTPTAVAMRTGKRFVCNDVRRDSRIFMRELLIGAGLHAFATLPLCVNGRPLGVLHLHATEAGFFDTELMELLERLALNLSFALENLQREDARENAERAVADGRRFLDDILNAVASPIVVKSEDHCFVALNDAAVRFLDRPREWILGKTDYDLFPAERAAYLQRTDDLALAERKLVEYESVYPIAGTLHTMYVRKFALVRGDGSRVLVLVMTDVTERKAAERSLLASEERFRALTELSSDWYWEQDENLRFTYMSPSASATADTHADAFLGKTRFELETDWASEEAKRRHAEDLAARRPFRDLLLGRVTRSGDAFFALVRGNPLFDSSGRFLGYRGTGRNVTLEILAEQRAARLRDFYAALSKANDAIIHARDQQSLFIEICEVAVTYGRVIFARICLIDPVTGFLENAAIAGNHQGYAGKIRTSINPDIPEGQGPTGIALRSGTPYVSNDILKDGSNLHWLPALTATGVRSSAVYPLSRSGRVVGSLHLYAAEANWFDEALVGLVDELAANISFALDNFDREAARETAERALRASEQRFRDIADAASEFMWENDDKGRFTYVSPKVVDVLGYTAEELVDHAAAEFMPPGEIERVRKWFSDHMQPDGSFRALEHMFIARSGTILWLSISGVTIRDEHGRPTGHRGTTRDVTEVKKSAARISYLATRDPLTELPNRLLFNDRLEQGINAARRKSDRLGVLFIDLDRFKNINDSLGHHIGDLLLKDVSNRMAGCIRKGDTLSRLGGDEFVVTLEGLANAEDAAQVARKIITSLTRPVDIGGHTLNTSCSIGISIYPNDAEDSRELMKNADTAMYHAKERGRNNFQFFSPEMNVRAVERHQLETELRRALEFNQFVLHYQPQADLRTGKLVGMEALIRWQHPERGLVPPLSFIPVAEESGLIEPIGQWALKTACEQNHRWIMEGLSDIKVAVNISARQFNDPKGFSTEVTRLLNATGLDPRYLELEMTESMLLKNVDENIAVLRRLGKLGTSLAVDDFGTGYSSLSYLKQLPIDTLKIDRTFVRDIESDPDDAAIIQAIIAMAHGLDLRVTAEGVETKGQLVALRKLGCDEYQGYLLSRPIPAAEFAARILVPNQAGTDSLPSGRAPASRGRFRRA